MAAIELTDLAKQAGTPKISRTEASDVSGQRFFAAMEKANTGSTSETQPTDRITDAASSKPVTDGTAPAATDAAERARRALDLNPNKAPQSKASYGDSILHGLQNLSNVFAAQEARINNLGSRPAADTNTLLSMQMEVAKFSALVDVTSKLTGKSTQVLDTLLKGQ
jgi:uncharacterized protein involved in copper resistance